MPKVFIGVGHGGRDQGAVGVVKEAAANLTIALKLKSELERHNVVVGMSRMKDENDPLSEEINEANSFAPDIAVDVHNNAGGGDGFEVYCQTNMHTGKSHALAKAIEAQVVAIGQKSRGIKTKTTSYGADYFGFLRSIRCPAVILEGFFVDNAKDARDFDTVQEQHALAVAYAKGILAYLGIFYTPESAGTKLPFYDDVKSRFGFEDATMEYLAAYKHARPLLEKLATRG